MELGDNWYFILICFTYFSSAISSMSIDATTSSIAGTSQSSETRDCYNTFDKGARYRGSVAQTAFGRTCQRWSSQTPHKHTRTPEEYPDSGLEGNYCRNPDNEPMPWCYTTDKHARWEYCAIERCQDCYNTFDKGASYRGSVAQTASGRTCQRWSSQTPHKHIRTPEEYPESGMTKNYCRNPDISPMPWCYTTDKHARWEYCAIERCQDCYNTFDKGASYRGSVAQTASGRTCQWWYLQTPHKHTRTLEEYPDSGLEGNYCRNPDNEPMPWCYTTDAHKRWEYCAIERCQDCYNTFDEGASYRGSVAQTASGRTCQWWSSQTPHKHTRTLEEYPDSGLEGNYCRNPDKAPMPWCYTTDKRIRWEYCEIKGCSDCYYTCDEGASYRGPVTRTKTGKTCQRWSSQTPHQHTRIPEEYPDSRLEGNYCRNPDNKPMTWCYTTDNQMRWEYCAIEQCSECYYTSDKGDGGRGFIAQTGTGKTCQWWCSQPPHLHTRTSEEYSESELEGNYCRNTDNEQMPSCCTASDEQMRSEYCNIEKYSGNTTSLEVEECIHFKVKGANYRGIIAKTKSGRTCQWWSSQTPHQHTRTPYNYPHTGLEGNYCRNPDNEKMPWCYTTDKYTRWEYCQIEQCPDTSCFDIGFVCEDNQLCIDPEWFCDGEEDCKDGSDERPRFLFSNSTKTGIPCRQFEPICLLPASQKLKEDIMCKKDVNCTDEEFACIDGSQCLSSRWFCDGVRQCNDGSDELPVQSVDHEGLPCRQDKYICELPNNQIGKKKNICKKNAFCLSNEFTCTDESGCLPEHEFCDGRSECKDGSDEKRYYGQLADGFKTCDGLRRFSNDPLTCQVPKSHQFCKNRTCLSNSTEFLDADCFRCLSYPYIVIPIAKLCNGRVDCPDFSDECMCKMNKTPEMCQRVLWGEEGDSQTFSCRNGSKLSNISSRNLCDGRSDCDDNADERDCGENVYDTREDKSIHVGYDESKNYTCPSENLNATRCNGIPECQFGVFDEECTCRDRPQFCKLVPRKSERSLLKCNTTDEWNSQYLIGSVHGPFICDGSANCRDEEDELFCTKRTHFYCSKGDITFIPFEKYCDQVADCDDDSDESNCSFKCPQIGSVEYIRQDQVCDGTQNCDEGEDECLVECVTSTFSSNVSMVKSKPVLGTLYFISAFALTGNAFVCLTTIGGLLRHNQGHVFGNNAMLTQRRLVNQVLILNLAISDLVVGIYTFAICIASSITDGAYCRADRVWRSGIACSTLGALLVIGSEQSVFTMILITVSRLRGVRRPFDTVPVKKFWIALALAWATSITLAIIPLLPSLEDTFITSIWYAGNKLFATITQNDVKNLTQWLLLIHAKSTAKSEGFIGSWSALEGLIGELNTDLKSERKYGFYSSHSVCIPDLFPDREKNASWCYSLFIVCLNFLAFVAIFLGCFSLYRAATKKSIVRSQERQSEMTSKMQTKLTIIVATDFICWMPVCIMAFLQLWGIDISDDWRLVIGLVIIPINSAANPIIYSNLPEMLWSKINPLFVWIYNTCIAPVMRFVRGHGIVDSNVSGTAISEILRPSVDGVELAVISKDGTAADSEIYEARM